MLLINYNAPVTSFAARPWQVLLVQLVQKQEVMKDGVCPKCVHMAMQPVEEKKRRKDK